MNFLIFDLIKCAKKMLGTELQVLMCQIFEVMFCCLFLSGLLLLLLLLLLFSPVYLFSGVPIIFLGL